MSTIARADPALHKKRAPKREWDITKVCSGEYPHTKKCQRWVAGQCEALKSLDFKFLAACQGTFGTLDWTYKHCNERYLGVKPSNPDPGGIYVPDPIAEIMPKTQLSYHDNLVQNRLPRTKWRLLHRSPSDWSNYLYTAGKNLCRDMMRATTHCRECGNYNFDAKECRVGITLKPGTSCLDYKTLPRDPLLKSSPGADIIYDVQEKRILLLEAAKRILHLIREKSMQYASKRERRVPILLEILARGYDLEEDINEIAKGLNASVAETKRTNALLEIWLRDNQLRNDQKLAEAMEMLNTVFGDVEERPNVTVI